MVEADQRLHVLTEPVRIGRETKAKAVLAQEPSLLAPDLRPEVRASRAEVGVPAALGDCYDRAGLALEHPAAELSSPSGPGEAFRQQEVEMGDERPERIRPGPVPGRAHRPEL